MSDIAVVEGKRVLVVGGTRGIGWAIAARFAQLRAEVHITGRDPDKVSRAADSLGQRDGQSVTGHALDVTDRAKISGVLERLQSEWGGVDVLVYNAGVSPVYASAEKVEPGVWDSILATNLTGAFIAAQTFARQRIAEGKPGSVILVGSVDSIVGDPRLVAYTASKAGLAGMARTMALDWARYDIRVNLVAPGYVATDLTTGLQQNERLHKTILDRTPLGRLADPTEISDIVVFLASESSSYVTGATLPVDGGWTAW